MNEIVKIENGEIVVAEETINQIIEFNKLKKEVEYQEKVLKEGLMKAMSEKGLKKFIVNGLSATIRDVTTKKVLDTKRLKEECPDIYEAYSKISEVKASIVLAVSE